MAHGARALPHPGIIGGWGRQNDFPVRVAQELAGCKDLFRDPSGPSFEAGQVEIDRVGREEVGVDVVEPPGEVVQRQFVLFEGAPKRSKLRLEVPVADSAAVPHGGERDQDRKQR